MKKSTSNLNVKKKISVKPILLGFSILTTTAICGDNHTFASVDAAKIIYKKDRFDIEQPWIENPGYYPDAQGELNNLFIKHLQNHHDILSKPIKVYNNNPKTAGTAYMSTLLKTSDQKIEKEKQRYTDEINRFCKNVNDFNTELNNRENAHGGDYPSYKEECAPLLYEIWDDKIQADRKFEMNSFINEQEYNQAVETINNGKKLSPNEKTKRLNALYEEFKKNEDNIRNDYAKEKQNLEKDINNLNMQVASYTDWNYEGISEDPYWNKFWD